MVLPLLLALVLTGSGAPLPTSAADDLDIEAARAGLHLAVDAYADWPAGRPLPGCPLLDRDHINSALATAGIDAPLRRWELDDTETDPPALACSGEYIGIGEESFPEVRVTVGAVDLGDTDAAEEHVATVLPGAGEPIEAIGSGSVGECAKENRADLCIEFWHRDGFAVAVTIRDRISGDRPTTATVLGDIVPDVVAVLAERSTELADPLAALSDDAVAAAAAGLDQFVGSVDEAAGSRFDCPAIDHAGFAAVLADVGIEASLDSWDASLDVLDSEGVEPPLVELKCHGRTHDDSGRVTTDLGTTLFVVDFGDSRAAEDYVAEVGLPEGGSADDLPPGENTVGSCVAVSGTDFCVELWRRDGFVVGVWLSSGTERIRRDDVQATLIAVVPDVVANLGAALDPPD